MSKPIYFAHSKRIYGTAEEKQILEFLSDKYGRDNVVCPHNDMGELGSIRPYLKRINKCSKVVARQYKGSTGRGVYEEVKHAVAQGKPVYAIMGTDTDLELVPIKGVKVNDSTDWAIHYGKLILEEP